MSTLLEMRSRIADDLDRSDLDTQITKAINRAIEYYEKEHFFFNETSGTFVTVANQESYGTADSTPSDLLDVQVLTITESSTNIYPLEKVPFDTIRYLNTSGTSSPGIPYNWGYFREKFWFYPVPNAVYTMTVYYLKSYTALSADGDTNDWTEEAEDLIEARARWWLNHRIIKDYEAAAADKAEELDAFLALRIKSDRLLTTGYTRKTDF